MLRGHIIDSDRLRLCYEATCPWTSWTKGRRVKSNTLRRSDPNSSIPFISFFFVHLHDLPFFFYTYDSCVVLALAAPVETHFYRNALRPFENGPVVFFIPPFADQSSDTRRARNKDRPSARAANFRSAISRNRQVEFIFSRKISYSPPAEVTAGARERPFDSGNTRLEGRESFGLINPRR